MSEELKNEGQTTGTTQPEANGAPTGKTFTQEEVNKIVSDRLAREREKAANESEYKVKYEETLAELESIKAGQVRSKKEAAVRAYYENQGITGSSLAVAMKGSAQEIDALEMVDGKIKNYASIDALIGGVFSGLVPKTTTIGTGVAHPPVCYHKTDDEMIRDAFKPKI